MRLLTVFFRWRSVVDCGLDQDQDCRHPHRRHGPLNYLGRVFRCRVFFVSWKGDPFYAFCLVFVRQNRVQGGVRVVFLVQVAIGLDFTLCVLMFVVG